MTWLIVVGVILVARVRRVLVFQLGWPDRRANMDYVPFLAHLRDSVFVFLGQRQEEEGGSSSLKTRISRSEQGEVVLTSRQGDFYLRKF